MIRLKRRRIILAAVIAFAVLLLSSDPRSGMTAAAQSTHAGAESAKVLPRAQSRDSFSQDGFQHFYNMEYDAAIHDFELALQVHPDDPFAVNHLLQTIFTRELDREGALNAELYLGNGFFHAQRVPVDAKVEVRENELTARALELSAKRLQANPNDVEALYARGVTRALHAAYLALVEKSWFAALRSALGSYEDHERVLRLSPDYTDANLVVGLYSYAMGSLPWPERAMTFWLPIKGSKSRGAEDVAKAANGSGETTVDAKIALAFILAREQRCPEAISLTQGLYRSYPHNFFFAMTEGDLLQRSGNLPAAISAYRELIRLAQKGTFPGARLGLGAYKLGESLRLQGDYAGALEAYGSVSSYPGADSELVSKATLSQGKMSDLLGQRNSAVKQYQEVIAAHVDSEEAKAAHQLLRHPYRIQ